MRHNTVLCLSRFPSDRWKRLHSEAHEISSRFEAKVSVIFVRTIAGHMLQSGVNEASTNAFVSVLVIDGDRSNLGTGIKAGVHVSVVDGTYSPGGIVLSHRRSETLALAVVLCTLVSDGETKKVRAMYDE